MVVRIGLSSARPVGIYFREWREWKGWTQEELAVRLETTAATVSRIENGARDWSKGYLESFAHVMDCPDPTDPIRRPPGTATTLDDILKDASPKLRRQAVSVVEALLKTSTDV